MKTSTYVALSTPYYSFDPRAKIIFTLLVCFSSFLPLSWMAQTTLTLFSLILSLRMLGVKYTWHNVRLVLPILVMMTVLLPFQGRGGEVLLKIKGLDVVTSGSVFQWQRIFNRFLLLSLMCSLLMETTKTSDLLLSFQFFRLPYSVALVLSLSMRLIPTIADTFTVIRDSQRLRLPNPGEEEAKKGKKVSSLLSTLTSVLVVSLKSISSTSEALELRGYGRKNKRSCYKKLKSVKEVFPHFILSVMVPAMFAIVLAFWR
ncbi:MAG: energy-coupling factor transporter transmembrane component T family protein [Candidatus Ornithospirochaeta sp.]